MKLLEYRHRLLFIMMFQRTWGDEENWLSCKHVSLL